MKKKFIKRIKQLRLYVFKSNKHIYAQIIDDSKGKTVVASSSLCPHLRNKTKTSTTCETAALVGQDIAVKLKDKGIREIIFDRGKRIYHGKIKALAEATREAGIKF